MSATTFWKKYLWNHLGFADLDTDEFNKRVTLVQLGAFTASTGTLYALLYAWLGYSQLAVTVWIYISVYLINLLVFVLTKNYNIYRATQPFLILLAPLVAHIAVGGFTDSSVVILACFLSPVTALAFANRKTAHVYHVLFIAAIITGGIWDIVYGPKEPQVPKLVYSIFFINNIIVICSITYFLLDNFLTKNKQLQEELHQSLDHLRATQTQLIHSEKMASLGELTAGIAHEIQNPMNFITNFSDVSIELLEELKETALQKIPSEDRAETDDILGDLISNLQKINHHGRRADSIVKGMLEHSRSSTGEKHPTDLNNLTDEYLKLSYHGLRAKNKEFNCTLVTDFDPNMPLLNVATQDVGRVLLNLFNNAFHAVQEKQKTALPDYQPTVTVSTLWNTGQSDRRAVEIRVKDNGTGMPESVRQKVFQPFFTTKPTGQGTGLGLSLSYDIITKGHAGELTVQTEPGESTEFIIRLPEKTA